MKNIKDYLHLYLYCEMRYSSHHEPQDELYTLTTINLAEAIEFDDKPILRPLLDMNEDEVKEFIGYDKAAKMYSDVKFVKLNSGIEINYMVDTNDGWMFPQSAFVSFSQLWPFQFAWLLSKGFDLFGLIEEGLAIDKSKVAEPTKM